MGFEEIAASAVKKLSIRSARKLQKKNGPAPEIPKSELVRMKNTTDGFYNVGFAKRITMPDDVTAKPYWLAGFRTGNRVTGVIDPMTVSAIWIDCKDNGGFIMVAADCVGITGYDIQALRDSLSEFCAETGCKAINVCCSHTHAGIDTCGYWGKTVLGPIPGDGKDPEFMKLFFGAIRDVCYESYRNRKEGRLYVGSVRVPEAQHDGRPPVVLHDVLTRIRFVPNDGTEETWFLNFAAHPNTMGGANSKVSADYPYYMRERIYKEKKTNVLFGVGAIAAVDAGMFSEDRLERTIRQGEVLGEAALSVSDDVQLDPEITLLQQPYYSPIDNGVLSLMGLIKTVNSLKYPCDKGELGLALKTELTYIKLGSLQILLIPGEAFPEFVYGGYSSAEESATGLPPDINPTPLVDIAGDKNLLVFGVTNDMTGYMVPPNDFVLNETQPYLNNGIDRFGRKHYHETNSLGYLTTETIAGVFADMMSRVK